MLKQSIGIGIMCLASHAYSATSNIIVNTQDDVTANDNKCSLREAVEYINQGMPTAGLNGCGGKESAAVIELEALKTYTLNSRINITKPLQLKTVYETSVQEQQGLRNAVIKMRGKDQLFNIYDGSVTENPINVNFNEVTLDGCGVAEGCSGNGGLVSNQERFTAQYVVFTNGVAGLNGGAIYNVGNLTNEENSSGYVMIMDSIFRNNTAVQGAAIYSELPRFNVFNSVIRDNVVKNENDGTVLFSAAKFNDASTSGNLSGRTYGLKNSTIFSNNGFVMNVLDGVVINNITAIRNSKGLRLNAPLGNASVSNSILLENGRYLPNATVNNVGNCSIVTGDKTLIQKNLVNDTTPFANAGADCGAGTAENPNINVGNDKVLAGNTVVGQCDAPPALGLLCPFPADPAVPAAGEIPKGDFLGFFRPRVLATYNSLNESPILNRGRFLSNGTQLSLASCENEDQRGKQRGENQICDLGAIELVVDTEGLDKVGQDILFGQVAEFNIANNLADGELVPASQCAAIIGRDKDNKGRDWQAGCVEVVQTNTPSKGTLTLSQNGDVRYVPDSNWNGSDQFKIRVVTTLTRLSDSQVKYIEIPASIRQSPSNSFQDKQVNTGSGAFNLYGLIGILCLMGLRRAKSL